MAKQQWHITDALTLENFNQALHTLRAEHHAVAIAMEPAKQTRSLGQNALYWKWVTQIAALVMPQKPIKEAKLHVHALLRHKFLGYGEAMEVDSARFEAESRRLYLETMQAIDLAKTGSAQGFVLAVADLGQAAMELTAQGSNILGEFVPLQLRSTTELNTGEMFFYMEQVEAWAADSLGLLVTIPADSEYALIKVTDL